MREVPKERLDFMREQYPKGSRIRLIEMADDPHPLAEGSMGTLDHIDDQGTFHVKWDNGRELGVAIGEDRFSVHPPEPTLLKLYMPLTATIYPYDEWGDVAPSCKCLLGGGDLLIYEKDIRYKMDENYLLEEAERGLMHWYGKHDSLDTKVRSVQFTAEARNGRLWGVAECRVIGELSSKELDDLKGYISGHASDGWGEGFEQREIQVDGGELYVHLWQRDNWSIQTEQERFAPKVAAGLPAECFSILASTGQLICIKRGESGYYPSKWNTRDKERNVELADELNDKLGVTPAQRQAMEIGSMAGWDVPGADPANYEIQREEQTEGGMTLG